MIILVICMAIIVWLAFGFSFYMKLAKKEVEAGYIDVFDWGLFLIFLAFGALGYVIYDALLLGER